MNDDASSRRWLVDYEIESLLAVSEESILLNFRHPEDLYEIHVSNLETEPGTETPLLSVQIMLDAASMDEAEDRGDLYIREFLYFLVFVTNSKFRVHRRNRLVDWTKGITEREQYIYKHAPPDQPFPFLSDDFLETVGTLQSWEAPQALHRALRWFSAGVGGRLMEDQFQYFWFVLELLAVAFRDPGKVSDKCSACRSDLYCPTCERVPVHRPYPKQSIRELVRKNVSNDPDKLFEKFDDVRNMLMHGAERDSIQEHLEQSDWPIPLEKVTDLLGSTAWTAILNSFTKPPGRYTPSFIQVSTYVSQSMNLKVHAKMGSLGDPDNPQIGDMPSLKMEVTFAKDSHTKGEEQA